MEKETEQRKCKGHVWKKKIKGSALCSPQTFIHSSDLHGNGNIFTLLDHAHGGKTFVPASMDGAVGRL